MASQSARAESLKADGNAHFQKGELDAAISSYESSLEVLGKASESDSDVLLRPTILSNLALCRLKHHEAKLKAKANDDTNNDDLDGCIKSCSDALDCLESLPAASSSDDADRRTKLRSKILYRRARAYAALDASEHDSCGDDRHLNASAKDLLDLIQIDQHNKEAAALLMAVRERHGRRKDGRGSNMGRALTALSGGGSGDKKTEEDQDHNLRIIMGLLTRDVASASMELGRRGGVSTLLGVATCRTKAKSSEFGTKVQVLALHALSAACSHGPFVRAYATSASLPQEEMAHLVVESTCAGGGGGEGGIIQRQYDVAVAAVALMLRLVVHLDHTDDKMVQSVHDVNGPSVCRACVTGLSVPSNSREGVVLQRACLDLLSAWTASDMDAVANAAEAADVYLESASKPKSKATTEADLRKMKPKEFAAHKKRQFEIHRRNVQRGRENAALFCDVETGGLTALLECAVSTDDHALRREVGSVIGRLVACFEGEDAVKDLVGPVLGYTSGSSSLGKGEWDEKEEEKGLTIEEIYDDDDEIGNVEEEAAPAVDGNSDQSLDQAMKRGQLIASLLLGNSDVGAWALKDGFGLQKVEALITSGDPRAMSIASEIVSAAASSEKGRPLLTPLVEDGAMEDLLLSDDREVRSGAASAIAKLGLANKDLSSDEGEILGLLQVAAELVEGADDADALLEKAKKVRPTGGASTSSVSTAADRGIEVLSYLSSKTVVKDEIAHGFKAPSGAGTILERLVELGSLPDAGELPSAYGIATVFALLAVSNETLRREAFSNSEMTPEQYDTLQDMGKTEEEKELDKKRADHDPMEAVSARIRKMADTNVPRAMVKLTEGATEATREQIVVGMNRMAVEESVRGAMVQQGCLSAVLKVEKGNSPSETEKQTWQQSRHCLAKLLVTTNPSLLTVSQRMGSIGPLIQLIHDTETTDLARFEALLAVTNIGSIDNETKNRIVAEKGIARLGYAMFSDHEMVRRAATEAMSNLIPHPKMMQYLADPEKLRLWVAFARDFEDNFECSRAAIGCLAMATQEQEIANELAKASHFEEMTRSLLECGNLELMHRMLVALLNLLGAGEKCREAVIATGAGAFCDAYAQSYHDGKMASELKMSEADKGLMTVTVDLAKEVASMCE